MKTKIRTDCRKDKLRYKYWKKYYRKNN